MKFQVFSIAALTSLTILVSCNKDQVDFGTAPAASLVKSGAVEVITKDKARYHVLNFRDRWTSTIVESETEVTLIDVGINVSPDPGIDLSNSGTELRAYADAINKPISVIITHDHVDHFLNLDKFQDVPVFAEAMTADLLKVDPAFIGAYPGNVTGVTGAKSIGGLEFHFGNVSGTEAPENGYVYIPSEKAVFTGDLTAVNKHSYIRDYTPLDGTDELSVWMDALKGMKSQLGDYEHIFVGHVGYETNVAGNFDKTIGYLTDAQGLIKGTKNLHTGGKATTVQEVVDELKWLYPNYGEGGLLFALPNAFFPGDPGANWF
ncbi:MAG: MBL fold metallo-hydrolase [Saprospiraceae bacterium]|nr:MBL fold metallo-hydrolase [Saprospiraceae bacterium]